MVIHTDGLTASTVIYHNSSVTADLGGHFSKLVPEMSNVRKIWKTNRRDWSGPSRGVEARTRSGPGDVCVYNLRGQCGCQKNHYPIYDHWLEWKLCTFAGLPRSDIRVARINSSSVITTQFILPGRGSKPCVSTDGNAQSVAGEV